MTFLTVSLKYTNDVSLLLETLCSALAAGTSVQLTIKYGILTEILHADSRKLTEIYKNT